MRKIHIFPPSGTVHWLACISEAIYWNWFSCIAKKSKETILWNRNRIQAEKTLKKLGLENRVEIRQYTGTSLKKVKKLFLE